MPMRPSTSPTRRPPRLTGGNFCPVELPASLRTKAARGEANADADLLGRYYDLSDRMVEPEPGPDHRHRKRISNFELERHKARDTDHWDRIPKLKVLDWAARREGLQRIDTVPRRPRPIIPGEPLPPATTVLRLDADAHHPEDGQTIEQCIAFLDHLKQNQFPDLYIEESPHGAAGYLIIDLAFHDNCEGPGQPATRWWWPSARQGNQLVDQVERLMVGMAKAGGYKCSLEVQGKQPIWTYREDGTRFIAQGDRPQPQRLPAFPTGQPDRDAFERSRINEMDLRSWVRCNYYLADKQPTPTPTPAPAPIAAPADPITTQITAGIQQQEQAQGDKAKSGSGPVIRHTGCKLRDAFDAVLVAAHETGVIGDTEADPDDIAETAHDVYEREGLASGDRDADRDHRIRSGVAKYLSTTGQGRRGRKPNSFTGDDIPIVAEAISPIINRKARADTQEELGDRRRGADIDHRLLALILLTYAVNHATTGSCPNSAIVGMAKFYGWGTLNGSTIAAARSLLIRAGLLTCHRAHYAVPGGEGRGADYAPTLAGARLLPTRVLTSEMAEKVKLAQEEEARPRMYTAPRVARGANSEIQPAPLYCFSLPGYVVQTQPIQVVGMGCEEATMGASAGQNAENRDSDRVFWG